MPPSEPSRRVFVWGWVLLALLWFGPLQTPHLFNPDEGRYAEIPREMLASGNWITPRLDAIKYFEKPPLQYWATAVAFRLGGLHAWTTRLWPALCGYLGLLLTYQLARRLYGRAAACFAVLVQAGSLLYVGLARVATLDMCLSVTLQLALAGLVLLARAGPQPLARTPRGPALLLAVGVALATLDKGLIGILIPGAVAVLYLLVYRDWRLILAARPWWTLVALALLPVPWFVLVSLRNPEFPHFFFVFEHFQRYLSSAGFNRYQPAWFFVPILLAGLIPWTGLLPRALLTGARAARREPATGMLLLWSGFIFAFFSASQSKLVPYILPMMPALSLLIGRSLADLPAPRLAAHLRVVAWVAGVLALAILITWRLPQAARLVARASMPSIIAFAVGFAALAVCAGIGASRSRGGGALRAAALATLGSLLFTQAALLGVDRLPRERADVLLVQALRPWIDHYRHFYCVGDYTQTVPFYLRRTCTLVNYRGELDFGLTLQPQLGIERVQDLPAQWTAERSAMAILRPPIYQQLRGLGMPMHVIYSAPSYVVVVRQ